MSTKYTETRTPPAPTVEERRKYWFGKTSRGQHARKDKTTGNIEVWWTGGDGYWSGPFMVQGDGFVCKPTFSL